MLRLIKGRTGKAGLMKELFYGSRSQSKCWINYNRDFHDVRAEAGEGVFNIERSASNKTEDPCDDLKKVLLTLLNLREYDDIYVYANFDEEKEESLKNLYGWLLESMDYNIRLNVTVQNDEDDIVISFFH